jgi:hypothetical protein
MNTMGSRVSSGSIVSYYGLYDRAIGVRSPARANNFSSILCVQTGSGAHPASCTMGIGGPFPGTKRGRGVMLTTHPHLVPRSWMSRSYTSSPPSAAMACRGTALLFFCLHEYDNSIKVGQSSFDSGRSDINNATALGHCQLLQKDPGELTITFTKCRCQECVAFYLLPSTRLTRTMVRDRNKFTFLSRSSKWSLSATLSDYSFFALISHISHECYMPSPSQPPR